MSGAGPLRQAAALAALLWAAPGLGQGQGLGLPAAGGGAPVEVVAEGGIEWDRNARTYTARGGVRAVQGDVAVSADVLTVHYHDRDGGRGRVSRLEAEGDVRITTPTQTARAERGVYEVDTGVFRLTGGPRLDTGTDRISARDSLEYREREGVAVARGAAEVRREGSVLRAETLRASVEEGADGRLRVTGIEAERGVVVTTGRETVRAESGRYDVGSAVVTLAGSVRLTRGPNQLNGDRAEVNLRTGVSRLFSDGGGVRGMLVRDPRADGAR